MRVSLMINLSVDERRRLTVLPWSSIHESWTKIDGSFAFWVGSCNICRLVPWQFFYTVGV